MAILIGKVDKVIFEDDGYKVVSVKTSGSNREVAVYRGLLSLPIRKSVDTQLHGEWVKHKTHGRQFNIRSFSLLSCSIPTKKRGRSLSRVL